MWIGLQKDLDAKKVFVAGGSYGGYMSLASMVHFGDRLRGGIDVVGISNFVTFLESTSAYRRDLRRAGIRRRAPAADARLSAEDLAADQRGAHLASRCWWCRGSTIRACRRRESQQMVAKIRARGGEVWYLAAKDEGHGFRKKANRDFYQQTIVTFLEKQLAAK